MIEQTLQLLTRDDVVKTIHEMGKELDEGERYSCLYQGRRFDPKALMAKALEYTKAQSLPAQEIDEQLYKPFIEALEALDFVVAKKPRSLGDTALPVMIYEVKKPETVQGNYRRLFSANQNRFYWNRDKFSKLKSGDPVFIVNSAASQVLFGFVQDTRIQATYDEAKDISSFSHQGEQFEVSQQYEAFVCIDVRKIQHTPPGWSWKTLGSGEHTYIAGPDVSPQSARNNLERVNLLLELFAAEEEIALQLQTCYEAVSQHLPQEEEPGNEPEPRLWYVMQGKTFSPKRALKYVWAPLSGKGGREFAHWTAVKDIRPGDIIIHHAESAIQAISRAISSPKMVPQPEEFYDEWRGDGHLVDVEPLIVFEPAIDSTAIRKRWQRLQRALSDVRGPFNRDGFGNQGYLFEFTWEALSILLLDQSVKMPEEIHRWLPKVEPDDDVPGNGGEGEPLPIHSTEIPAVEWLPRVQAFMASQGFHYSLPEVANFYLCLRTKPLALLAGISGTGKTQLVRQFAKALGYGDPDHCELIAVRPDWADSSDLLGYTNIQGNYESQPLLKVIERAMAHPDDLYFVVLDEMNLARVEHYFAEVLSFMETRMRDSQGQIVTEPLVNRADVNGGRPVYLPQNLMLVGTVNMDETTHPFSRKVLDRANAIEMNDIDLEWPPEPAEAQPVSGVYADALLSPFLNSVDLTVEQKVELSDSLDLLKKVNRVLEPAGLHFGYRVRDEIAFYLTLHKQEQLGQLNEFASEAALDFQLIQKVLPRIQGSSTAVLKALIGLISLFSGKPIPETAELSEVESLVDPEATSYPRSVKKLLFMLQRFNDDGFTSYWL